LDVQFPGGTPLVVEDLLVLAFVVQVFACHHLRHGGGCHSGVIPQTGSSWRNRCVNSLEFHVMSQTRFCRQSNCGTFF
jgi:hypothetical protein